MKKQESSKLQSKMEPIPQEERKPSKFSVSCKALCCCIFVVGAILNILLTTILLFGVENYHKADPVKIYEVFESPKYAETNQLLDNTQYLVLYGQPQSGILNFIEHEANLRAIEGKPVVMRDLQQNVIQKYMKQTKHFVQMYLGQVGRGHHSWFILLNGTETPTKQIQSLQKRYPNDSIVLIAHKKLNIEGFVNHKFPTLKSKELKQFMQKDLDLCAKQVKQVFDISSNKQAPSIFEAYKRFQDAKTKALQQAQLLRQQQQQEKLRLEQQSKKTSQVAQQQEEPSKGKKSSKKDKSKASKGKKNKVVPEPEEQKVKEQVQQQTVQQQPVEQKSKKNKSNKKDKVQSSKNKVVEPEQIEEVQQQAPEEVQQQVQNTKKPKGKKLSNKKSNKKSDDNQVLEEKVQQQLQNTLQQVAAAELITQQEKTPAAQEQEKQENKKIKDGKKNKNKKVKQQKQPQQQKTVETSQQVSQVVNDEVTEQVPIAVQEVVAQQIETKVQPEVKEEKKSKGKSEKSKKKQKKNEQKQEVESVKKVEKQNKKGKKGNKKSSKVEVLSQQVASNQQQTSIQNAEVAEVTSEQETVSTNTDNDSTQQN